MTAKDYLSQAYRIENMIDVKLDQLQTYKALSTKATSVLSASPKNGTPNIHRMENVIIKIMDLENEILSDMNALLDVRVGITQAINGVKEKDYRMLLELRYLCYMQWNQIAAKMQYSKDHIFTLHRNALNKINLTVKPLE